MNVRNYTTKDKAREWPARLGAPAGRWTSHCPCAKVLATDKGSDMAKNMRGIELSGWSYTAADAAVQRWGTAWSRVRRRRRDMGRGIRHTAGFTLIELMVVIIILGLLAAIVMPRIVGETDKARYGAALAQMRILEDALKRYKLDNGLFPTTDQGLEALVRRPTSGILPRGWPEGGYLDKQEIPRDPWGNAYVYI